MLREDRPLLRRLLLERCTLEMARDQMGPFSTEGFRLAGKIERLSSHIEGVEGREPEEFWAEHQPLLQAIPQIEAHYPDALIPLELYDPARRCRKCGGKARASYEPDRLKRTCRRCTFSWYEIPLDAEKPPSPEAEGSSPEEPEGVPGLTEGEGEVRRRQSS